MALLIIEILILFMLITLCYSKIAYPIIPIITIVYFCSIFLMFILTLNVGGLANFLGGPILQIYFLVIIRIAIASLISFAYFRDDYKLSLLTISLTAIISIYNREWVWMK